MQHKQCFSSYARALVVLLFIVGLNACATVRIVEVQPATGTKNASFYLIPKEAWEKRKIEAELEKPDVLKGFTPIPAPAGIRRPEGHYFLVTVCDGVVQAGSSRPIFIGPVSVVHEISC